MRPAKLWLASVALSVMISPAALAQDAEPTGDAKEKADEEEQAAARNIAVTNVSDKDWFVTGTLQFRTLMVSDEDPGNGRSMQYRLQGAYQVLDWLMGFARIGVTQRFVAQEGESGVRFQDMLLGAIALHSISLESLGWDRKISFLHRGGVYLPTSFESQQQDMYAATELLSQARIRLIDQLYFGAVGLFQYRFHQYAERAGLEGGLLPRAVFLEMGFVEYMALRDPKWGSLTLGFDVYATQSVTYPSRDDHESAVASQVFTRPGYGYDIYLTYVPLPNLAVTLSVEQGGSVLRDGIVNTFFFHRDETEFVATLTARY